MSVQMEVSQHTILSIIVMVVGALMLFLALYIYLFFDFSYNLFDFGTFLLIAGAALLVTESKRITKR
jgi:membrane-bound ClpP family serine protease